MSIGLDLLESSQYTETRSSEDPLNELIKQTEKCLMERTEKGSQQGQKDLINAEQELQIDGKFTAREDELQTELPSDYEKKTTKVSGSKECTDRNGVISEIRDHKDASEVPSYIDTGDTKTVQVCSNDNQPVDSSEESNSQESKELVVPGPGPLPAGSQNSTVHNINDPQLEVNDCDQPECTDLKFNEDQLASKINSEWTSSDLNTEERKNIGKESRYTYTTKLKQTSGENNNVNSTESFSSGTETVEGNNANFNETIIDNHNPLLLDRQNYDVYDSGNSMPVNGIANTIEACGSNTSADDLGHQIHSIENTLGVGHSRGGEEQQQTKTDSVETTELLFQESKAGEEAVQNELDDLNDTITNFIADVITRARNELISGDTGDKTEDIVNEFFTDDAPSGVFDLNNTVSSAISDAIGHFLDSDIESNTTPGVIESREVDPENYEKVGRIHTGLNSPHKDTIYEGDQIDSFPSDLSEFEGFTPRSEVSNRTYDSESITSYDSWFDSGARLPGQNPVSRGQVVERVRTASVLTAGSSVDWTSSSSSSECDESQQQQYLEALCEADITEAAELSSSHSFSSEETELGEAELFSLSVSQDENKVFTKRPTLQKSEAIDHGQSYQSNEDLTNSSEKSLEHSTSPGVIVREISNGTNYEIENIIRRELNKHPNQDIEFQEEKFKAPVVKDSGSMEEQEGEDRSIGKKDNGQRSNDDTVHVLDACGPPIQSHTDSCDSVARHTSTPTPDGERDSASTTATQPGLSCY